VCTSRSNAWLRLQLRSGNQDRKTAGETITPLTDSLKTVMKGYTVYEAFQQVCQVRKTYLLAVLVCRKYSCREDAKYAEVCCMPIFEALIHCVCVALIGHVSRRVSSRVAPKWRRTT
jgi:hypothetical protein